MANDFALGKALEIPQNVLKNIDAIDKKINNISNNAERMAKAFNSAFTSAGGNANTFIQHLTSIQDTVAKLGSGTALGNLSKGFGNTASQAEKVVNSVTRVATTMNKLASSSNSGFSPNSSILAWQGLQKNIEQVQQRQEQLLKITREYENELSRINSGKGGVLSKSQTESYQNALKEIETNKQVIASYREKQQAIITYQAQQRQELQNLQALKNYESQRTSLPEQRSANELKRLNEYYKELEKSSAKAAEAQEKAAQRQQQAQERAAAAAERAAQRQQAAQQRAAQQQDTRINNKAIDAYNRAMAASEALVTQRINKIAKLRQAEEMLTATGRNYTAQLQRIQSEISRLNKLNEGQIRANGQIIRSQHNLMDISGQLARKLALVFSVSQISSYLIKLRDVTGEFELQNTALASILKNQNQADILFQQITDLAVRSPFTVKQLTTYTKSLSAYGFEYEKLYDTTKRLADVAAGLGVDMQRIILAYGQVSAANFLRGCLGYGTPVMLYDGTIKQVQDIVVGDVLINENGEPVNVLELIRGRETMFLVEQVSGHNRTSYRVNRNHILTLWNVQEQRLEDVYVYDYLKNTEAYLGLKIVDGKKVYYDIEVTKDKIDDYYGFVLDGNKRFRLGDGTITHNTETRQFSEAGLNILKELAEYYSEVEGRAVSLGEVQDRQFKKMISFQDVEEVFKRITSEGGTFYQMQERQAETIAGQVSNLQDSIDIMLNSIGQANRETIITMISAVKSLVENWQIFADMLNGVSVFMTVYTAKTLLAAAANGKFSASALAATASAGGLRGALATVLQGFQSIFNFAKANPWLLIASAVVALGSGLYTHAQNVKAAREQYDSFTNSLQDNKKELDDIATKIGQQNARIEQAHKVLEQSNKKSTEYARAQAVANAEIASQASNLDELKQKFPDVYNEIIKNTNGTIDLAAALEHYNKIAEDTEHINNIARGTTSFFNEGFEQNLKDASNAQMELNKVLEQGNSKVRSFAGDLKAYLQGQDDDYSGVIKKINEIVNSSQNAETKYEGLLSIYQEYVSNLAKTFGDFSDVWDFPRKIQDAKNDVEDANNDLAANIEDIGNEIREDFDLTTEHGKKNAKEAAENYLNHLNNIDSETKKFAAERLTKIIGVKIDWGTSKQEIQQALYGDWRDVAASLDISNVYKNTLKNVKNIKDFEDDLGKTYRQNNEELKSINRALSNQSPLQKQIAEANKQARSDNEEIAKQGIKRFHQLKKEEEQYKKSLTTRKQNLENEQNTIKNTAKQMNLVLTTEKERNKAASQRRKEEQDALKDFKERVRLIRQAGDEYKKLRQYSSVSEATATVRDMYKDSVIGGIVGNMTFDEEGIIKQLEKLRPRAKKLGKEAMSALQEGLRENQREIEIKISKKSIDDAKKELDEAFDEYDLSKELLGTGFNKGAIKAIFNIDTTSIDDLKKKLEEMKKRFGDLSEEEQKTLEDYSKKLQEIQDKELLERTKKYAEYLKYQYSEATKIMLQLRKDMAEVATLDLTDVQKQSINQRLQEEANKKIQEQTWKDFKGSDMYTQMFDDLSKVSSKGLDYMVERLEELKGTLNNLDPSDLKEIINQINKIEEEQIKRNPLEGLGDDIKEAWEFAKQRKELEEQITAEYEKQKTLIEQIPRQEQTTEESRKNYEKVVSVFGEDSDQAKEAKKTLDQQEKALADVKQELTDSEKKAGKLKDQYDKGAQAAENVKNKTAEFANKINQAVDSMQTLVNGLNSVFNMSDAFNDTMSSIMEFGTNMANTITSAGAAFAGFASGTPQGIFTGITQSVSAIGSLMSSIGSLLNIGDKKKEREIQRQIEKVNELQNAYEKLYDTIQNGLSLKVFSDNAQLTENLQKQIRSYQKMIAAEEDKKHSDKERIKEWQENISDLYDQIAELYDSMKEELVGNFKSLSEQLADSLVSAFENGEDAAESWGDTVKQAIVDILQNLLVMKYIEPQVQKILDNLFSQAMPDTSAAEKVSERLAEAQEEYTKLLNEDPNGIRGFSDYKKRKEQLEKEIKQLQEQYDALNEKAEGEIPNITEGMVDSTIVALTALQDSVINSPIVDIIQGLIDDMQGDDELSSLQRGIQGLSETTGQALEALLESIRFYVVDENEKLTTLVNSIMSTDSSANPMLAELQVQTALVRSIEGMMSSVIKVSGGKGRVLRVEIA